MPRKKKEEKQLDGTVDIKQAVDALCDIEKDYGILPEESLQILEDSFARAYKSLANEDCPANAEDMRIETSVDIDKGTLAMFELKDVVATDDDIEDDFLQISLDEAQKVNPDIKVGEQLRLPINLQELDERYIAKSHQLFLQKMRERTKSSIKNLYIDKIGTIIKGKVDNIQRDDNNGGIKTVKVSFDKANGLLRRQDLMKNDNVFIGQEINCYLKGVDEKRKNEILIVSRSDSQFLGCIFKDFISEIASGIVKINSIAREAGIRSKVAVSSTNPDIDTAGSCIGPDGIRINSIRELVNGERIDIVHYQDKLELYIAEALHPATVVGVSVNSSSDKKTCIAVVKNGEKKEAIGKGGVNVRLASRLVGYSIDVLETDEAMEKNVKYVSLDDIRRDMAMSRVAETETVPEEVEDDELPEIEEETVVSAPSSLDVEVPEDVVEEKEIEEVPEVHVEKAKKVEEPVEHVEIKSQSPKISLAALEAQIEEEKKANKGNANRSFHKKKKENEDEEEFEKVEDKKAVNSLPIYTEEELKQFADEEEEDDYDSDEYDEYEEEYGNY